jgi:hypothetical protein
MYSCFAAEDADEKRKWDFLSQSFKMKTTVIVVPKQPFTDRSIG